MAKLGLWTRMGGWLRGGSVVAESDDDEPGDVPEVPGVSEVDVDSRAEDVAAADRITASFSRRGRREHSLGKLQEGYDRVLELMDQIQQHMRSQEDRTEQIATAISDLSRSLADVPGLNKQQIEFLSAIAAQLETTTVRAQQLGDAIGELPRVVRGQTDALTGIQRQLEMGAESDANLSSALQSFGRGVDRLGEAAEDQSVAMRNLREAGDERQRRLDEVIRRQSRLFTVLVAITAVLAGAGIVVGTIAVVLQLSG